MRRGSLTPSARVYSLGKSRLYGPFVNGVITVFGLNPAAACEVLPKAYQAAFWDCGEFQVLDFHSGRAQMLLAALPPEGRDRDWLVCVAGGFEAIFDMCRVLGRVELEFDNPRSDPRFHAAWDGTPA